MISCDYIRVLWKRWYLKKFDTRFSKSYLRIMWLKLKEVFQDESHHYCHWLYWKRFFWKNFHIYSCNLNGTVIMNQCIFFNSIDLRQAGVDERVCAGVTPPEVSRHHWIPTHYEKYLKRTWKHGVQPLFSPKKHYLFHLNMSSLHQTKFKDIFIRKITFSYIDTTYSFLMGMFHELTIISIY